MSIVSRLLMQRRFRIGFWLTLLLVAAVSLWRAYVIMADVVGEQDRRHLATQAAELSRIAQWSLENNDRRLVEMELAHAATNLPGGGAAVIDEMGVVRFAHRVAWVGRPALSVIEGFNPSLFWQMTQGPTPRPVQQQSDHVLTILVPYVVPATAGQTRSLRRGAILLWMDSGAYLADVRRLLLEALLPLLALGAALAAALLRAVSPNDSPGIGQDVS